ncbi:hypothetical protein LguiA_023610 [Lonicera macranthoides]
MSSFRFLFANGVVSPSTDTPSVTTLLEAHPGAYTTSRTHNNGSHLLFWDRHLRRLSDSWRILFNLHRELLFKPANAAVPLSWQPMQSLVWESVISSLVNNSMRKVLPVALKQRKSGEELAITTLLSGNLEKLSENENVDKQSVCRLLDVFVHVGPYVPLTFGIRENCAHLAMVGHRRDVANAKYSDWVRLRKPLEKLRPPLATELLLSSDGDRVLEGCLTNFFVVCRKDRDLNRRRSTYSVEVQTASISDGVLPGVLRQVIIEICSRNGIPFREVAPSWSERELWEEAFITNSLRILQHVETIRVPTSWESVESKTWKELTWEDKRFEDGPGRITALIQEEILEKAGLEGYPVTSLNG